MEKNTVRVLPEKAATSALAPVTVLALCFATLFGCSTARKALPPLAPDTVSSQATNAPAGPLAEAMGPPELYGPVMPEPSPAPAQYGPMPQQHKKIVLVLGPGMARGYAYVGALKALAAAKIPIAAILGTEIGGMFGAIYGLSGKPNHIEWALQQLRNKPLYSEGGLLPGAMRRHANSGKLRDFLVKVIGKKSLESARIPIQLSAQEKSSETPFLISRGDAPRAP